jgi:Tol biopolymer transport system component
MSINREAAGMQRTLRFVVALALAAMTITGAPSDAAETAASRIPVRNGKLAFSEAGPNSGLFGFPSDLFTIDPDGSNRQRLSHCTAQNCMMRAFAWSPDGRRLAFVRGRGGGSGSLPDLSLYVVDADGSAERRLDGCGKPRWPSCGDFVGSQISWSPDGSRLVVPREWSLYVFNVDRNRFRRLTKCRVRRCADFHPAWAPDGRRIVFARLVKPDVTWLYSIRADGVGLRRLTKPHVVGTNPVWSPDGREIAFDGSDNHVSARIFVIAANGSGLRRIRSGPWDTGPGVPAWSPNGRRIAFLTTPGTPGSYRAEIWVINRNGTGRRLLYRSACCIGTWGRPIWSPDGRYVAFGVGVSSMSQPGYDPNRSGIFVIKADGTGLRRLASAPTEAGWQRVP